MVVVLGHERSRECCNGAAQRVAREGDVLDVVQVDLL